MTTTNPSDAPPARSARDILERSDLAAYHGFLKYLQFRADHAAERQGGEGAAEAERARLVEWTNRILDNASTLATLRGIQEWAYESRVDGSGQPFKIMIPTDYDPTKPAPLSLYMHGYSGNHLEHASDMQEHGGYFEVSVLGRSRGGGYRALSEADVLQVLDYIEKHWAIDLDRVHLNGGSMGGGGTFWLGSRYPHRFASGRTVCGYASDKPLGNLLTLPIYATHSDDDWVVPVLHSRGPLARLIEMGGQVVYDETTGYGHAVWDYKEGNARSEAWFLNQVRSDSRTVKRLDFTALDGGARRAFWAEIAEWGPQPEPAHFVLSVEAGNTLRAQLENIDALTLRLDESPLDRSASLQVSIEGAAPLDLAAPLPASLVIRRNLSSAPQGGPPAGAQHGAWSFVKETPVLPFRLHTPGGANQLYDGEPLLVVYGTRGNAEVQRALLRAAEVASRSSSAAWPSPNGDLGSDGVAHNQSLYGSLNIKADVTVTPDDIARRHLVLIGTAAQNALVERLAARLPVAYGERLITFNDGLELGAEGNAIGLVHYNPEAPTRLIFWIASADPVAYGADSFIPELMGSSVNGADCVVARAAQPTLVVARSFDSRWRWIARQSSKLLPESIARVADLERAIAESVRRAIAVDFAVSGRRRRESDRPDAPPYVPGTTRLSDIQNFFYYQPVGVLVATGAQLFEVSETLSKQPEMRLQPAVERAKIKASRSYRVALRAEQISAFVAATHFAPRTYRVTDMTAGDALEQFGVSK